MTALRNITAAQRIIPSTSDSIKAQIIASGLSLGRLAMGAGMARSTLSDYLYGRIRNGYGQIRIVEAYNDLTGNCLSARQFWRGLAAREVA